MAGALKKTMVYLGFAEDDRYDDYYGAEAHAAVSPPRWPTCRAEP